MFPEHITVFLFLGLFLVQDAHGQSSTIFVMLAPTPSSKMVPVSSQVPQPTTKVTTATTPTTETMKPMSQTTTLTSSISASTVSSSSYCSSVALPTSPPQPCPASGKPTKESTCGQYVIHLPNIPWKEKYLDKSSMDYKELKNLLSTYFCDVFGQVVSKVWLLELTFSKASGGWTIAKAKVCVVFKPGVPFYMEDAKLNFTTNYTFEAIGVTFSEWKAKDGECKKCDGGGPFVIESECKSKEYSCRGHKNKSQESKDCVKHCPSASNLVVAAVSNLILAMWISLSFK